MLPDSRTQKGREGWVSQVCQDCREATVQQVEVELFHLARRSDSLHSTPLRNLLPFWIYTAPIGSVLVKQRPSLSKHSAWRRLAHSELQEAQVRVLVTVHRQVLALYRLLVSTALWGVWGTTL